MAKEDPFVQRPTYYFHKDYERQTLIGHVSIYRDDLAEEFHKWRGPCETDEMMEGLLAEWEVQKFGAVLPRAEHCMLLHAVRCTTWGGPKFIDKHWSNQQERERYEDAVAADEAIHGEPPSHRLNRILSLVGKPVPKGDVVPSFPDLKGPVKTDGEVPEFETSGTGDGFDAEDGNA